MNAQSIAQTDLVSKAGNMTVAVVSPTPLQLYRDGFDAYCEGQQLEDMPTEEQRRGWWAALDAQAACDMPQRKVHVLTDEEMRGELVDYENDMLDREDWARGAW